METKTCAVCGKEFTPVSWNQKTCSPECGRRRNREYARRYYREHKQERRDYQRLYYQGHKEEFREYHRKYYQGHKEEQHEYARRYYREHKEEQREYHRKYYLEHKQERRGRGGKCDFGGPCFECPYPDCIA